MNFEGPIVPQMNLIPDMQKLEMLKTGTTTIGIVIKDGVILATESQVTAGYTVANKKIQKLFKINNQCGATIAGGVADCQYVVSQTQAISRLLTIKEKEPTLNYISSIVRNILFNGRSFFYAFMIVGGYDHAEKVGKVFPIDFLGYMSSSEEFVSLGSGSTFALGVMEANWRPDMLISEGVDLIKQALTASRNRDIASGGEVQIVSITKEGFKVIEGPFINK